MIKTQEEMEQAIFRRFLEYRSDPVSFATEVIGIPSRYIWFKMREVLEAISRYQKVAVKAGHSVSKTFSVGRVVVPWFKTCFQPSTVVTTAPSDHQVKNQLWREIHAGFNSAKSRRIPLGGKIHTTFWDMKPQSRWLDRIEDPMERANWEKNFVTGFSTSPDTAAEHATKMHGWHNDWVLAVLDEVCGLAPQITRTVIDSLITDDQCKVLAIGNPTDPESEFAQWCHSSDIEKNEGKDSYMSDEGFWVIRIDARDNPNYVEGKRVIPGLAGRDFIDRVIKKYGVDGDGTRYRVLGLFPTHKEGTYYGLLLAQARREGRVGDYPYNPIYPVHTFSDFGDRWTATIFAQKQQDRWVIIDDYWDNEGQGSKGWASALKSKDYIYGSHFAGPDLTGSNAKSFHTGNKLLKDVLASLGFNVKAVKKHSFNGGIEAVRDIFPMLHVNKECRTFLDAAKGYGKKKDMRLSTDDQIVYHDQPAKTWHRHMCLAGDTIIWTKKGHIPIKNVRDGDYVMTPGGYRRVLASNLTGKAHCIRVLTRSGKNLVCTPNHKVFTHKTLDNAEALRHNDVLISNSFIERSLWKLWLNLMGKDIGFRRHITRQDRVSTSIGKSGNTIMVRSRRIITYITLMATRSIMQLRILNALVLENITRLTMKAGTQVVLAANTLIVHDSLQTSGTSRNRVGKYTESLVGAVGSSKEPINCKNNVSIVARFTKRIRQRISAASSVLTTAVREIATILKGVLLRALVLFVESLLSTLNKIKAERVEKIVPESSVRSQKEVYNLTVENDHCYYANGILVSNCDALRHLAVQEVGGGSVEPQSGGVSLIQIKKWQKKYGLTG